MGKVSTNSQTFYNFLSTIIRSGVLFITMPLFTRLLGAEQFGEYAIYSSWLAILSCFIGLNIKSSLGAGFYHYGKRYFEFRSSVFGEGICVSIILIIVLIVVYPISCEIISYSFPIYVFLLVESLALYVLDFINFAWVYEKKAKWNMFLSVTMLFSSSALSVLFIVCWKDIDEQLYLARVIGTIIPQIFFAIVVFFIVTKANRIKYNKEYWRYGITFGMPMVFHLLSQQVLSQSDRIMLKMYGASGVDVGSYSFFCTFVAILTTILGALNNSWCPFLYDDLKRNNIDILNVKVKNYVQIFTAIIVIFLLLSREVSHWFTTEEYWIGIPLIPVLTLVVYITFIYQFAVNYELYCEKPNFIAVGTTAAAITNIIFNICFIPLWGMYGAATATLFSYLVLAMMHICLVKKWAYKRYPLSLKSIWIGLCIVLCAIFIFVFLESLIAFRWGLAILVGLYIILIVRKRRKIF